MVVLLIPSDRNTCFQPTVTDVGAGPVPRQGKKKADVVADGEICNHVGLLVNGPPGAAELPFI
jgi:hypothetical protein